jgi:phenylacetate-CoA ligase
LNYLNTMTLIETMLRWKGFPLKQAGIKYDTIQKFRGKEFHEWQLKQRDAILHHHLEKNIWYRTFIGSSSKKWEDLPILQKTHLQQPIESLLTKPYSKENVYIGNTSGSSGHPFYYAKDKMCHALTWAEIKHLYALHDIGLNDRQARFYGIPLSGKSRIIEQVKDWVANRTRFPVFDLSDSTLEKWIEKFKNIQFIYLYGYTSSLVYFARYCLQQEICLKDICPSIRLCIVTSEVCTAEDRDILSKGFGVPVINEYGASEVGLIAFEYPDGDWKLCEELNYVEIVDENNKPVPSGHVGRILLTSLFNEAFPIIRYEIGDLGVYKDLSNGRKALLQLQGRLNDVVQLPSGKTSSGLTLYYVARSLLEKTDIIKEFIIVQTKIDTFQFQIHSKRTLNKDDKALLTEKLQQYLEPGLKLDIYEVDRIDRPGSGKIKHFYSKINQ